MTIPRVTACQVRGCVNFRSCIGPPDDPVFVCMAFPTGIPEEILSGESLHERPYPGDGGIRYERVAGEEGLKGGPGSGHRGHRGKPGQRGGSSPGQGISQGESTAERAEEERRTTIENAINRAASRCLKTPFIEEGIVIDSTGSMLFEVSGDVSTIYFNEKQVGRLPNSTVVHDHPYGGGFSFSDISLAVRHNLEEIVAVSRNPRDKWGVLRRYRLRRPEEGWPIKGDLWLRAIYTEINLDLQAHYWPLIKQGKITPEQANFEHALQENRQMAEKLGAEFTFEETPL